MIGRHWSRWAATALGLVACVFLAGCGAELGGPAEAAGGAGPARAEPPAPRKVELVWPTPNDAFLRGAAVGQFVQPTESGLVSSGLFGSVRSGGRQFHEGLDLYPINRDKRGEALDPIFAAMSGVVRHVSARAGASNYGRYVVLEHPEQSPPVYTLYAHLASIEPGLAPGAEVAAGATLGVMGRSAGGYTIPKERAHLHFEIGLRVTDRFQDWYRRRGFGSPNEHGLWNGMNLMGLDPLDFFSRARDRGLRSLDEVLAAQPRALRLRIARDDEPDFARRYPSLIEKETTVVSVGQGGWEIEFSVSGVPLKLKRLPAPEFSGWRRGEVRILEADEALLRSNRGRDLVKTRRGVAVPDRDLETVLEQLFPP